MGAVHSAKDEKSLKWSLLSTILKTVRNMADHLIQTRFVFYRPII